jgi:hypothetical protein
MSDQHALPDRVPTEALTRVAGALILVAVAIVHVIDAPGTFDETPLIGYGYLILIAATLAAAVLLVTVADRRVWALAGLVAAGAIVAYVLSRTTGLPTDDDDVGNWNCALGIAALCTETLVVALSAWRLSPRRRAILHGSSDLDVTAPMKLAS